MKDGFVAKKVYFQGVPGYMLTQYINGKNICQQFIDEESFDEFCEATGIEPLIIGDKPETTMTLGDLLVYVADGELVHITDYSANDVEHHEFLAKHIPADLRGHAVLRVSSGIRKLRIDIGIKNK